MEAVTDDITFRPAWHLNDPQIIRDVKRLWSASGLSQSMIDERQSEICAAAYGGQELAAVSSADIFYSPILRNNFFAYRCLVAPKFRQHDLAWRITDYSLKFLQNWAAQHAADKRIMGLMTIIETDKFTAGLRRPVREKFGMTMHFVAYTPEGHQVRIFWFDHAELDDGAVRE